jgi:hypothetical protein
MFNSIIDNSKKQEEVVQRKIEAMTRFIGEDKEGIQIGSVTKRHFQLEIQTLQNAPRDVAKLEQIIKAKEKQNEEATHFEDTQRLLTLKCSRGCIGFLVCRGLACLSV